MSRDQEPLERDARLTENSMMDSILYDGVDPMATRRAHMRDVTMARQAAERRFAQRGPAEKQDRPARLTAAKERAAALRLELERINVANRQWQIEHGEAVLDLPDRGHRKISVEEQRHAPTGEFTLDQMSESPASVDP